MWWDITAAASAELGPRVHRAHPRDRLIWGKPTWGVFWVWDARLTSTAMLGLLLLGYLAVRRLPARARPAGPGGPPSSGCCCCPTSPSSTARSTWWRSLHQGTTILDRSHPKIHDQMLFTLVFCMLVVRCSSSAWLLIHRWRLAWLEQQLEADRARPGHRRSPSRGRSPARRRHERLALRRLGWAVTAGHAWPRTPCGLTSCARAGGSAAGCHPSDRRWV